MRNLRRYIVRVSGVADNPKKCFSAANIALCRCYIFSSWIYFDTNRSAIMMPELYTGIAYSSEKAAIHIYPDEQPIRDILYIIDRSGLRYYIDGYRVELSRASHTITATKSLI